MQKLTIILALAVFGIGLGGCSPEARDSYGEAGKDLSEAGKKTGDGLATDAKETKIAMDNGLLTGKVKSALQTAQGLDSTSIDVDSNTKIRVITLNGSVPTEDQRDRAVSLAKGVGGPEYSVLNQLKVVPR